MAKGRQRRNHIQTIKDGQRVLSDMDEIFASCTTYFKNLLTDNAGSELLASNVCTSLRVTEEENELLVSPIRDEEIQWAVLWANKDSPAGPDSFNNRFYQSYWSIIGLHVSLAVKEFFRSGRMVKGINNTHIVLLPKEEESTTAQESNFGNRWNGVIIANMISPTSWPLIQDTMNCTELFADQETYVHMFLDSMSIPMRLPMLEDSQQDILEWVGCGSRPFSRHHIWDILRDSSPTQQWRIAIWNVGAPPHAAWTTYLAVVGRLHVDARAREHGLYLASRCYICKKGQEDINHVFFHCKEDKSLWELVIKKFRQSNFHPLMVKDTLVWWTSRKFKNKVLFKC
ncbi:hypothetical protein EJ110_NYTH59271 [Nymphaea thermarum]|nr:hypothetical protein EJ110_NYTH59271 [Nymphaea thermarum]